MAFTPKVIAERVHNTVQVIGANGEIPQYIAPSEARVLAIRLLQLAETIENAPAPQPRVTFPPIADVNDRRDRRDTFGGATEYYPRN